MESTVHIALEVVDKLSHRELFVLLAWILAWIHDDATKDGVPSFDVWLRAIGEEAE